MLWQPQQEVWQKGEYPFPYHRCTVSSNLMSMVLLFVYIQHHKSPLFWPRLHIGLLWDWLPLSLASGNVYRALMCRHIQGSSNLYCQRSGEGAKMITVLAFKCTYRFVIVVFVAKLYIWSHCWNRVIMMSSRFLCSFRFLGYQGLAHLLQQFAFLLVPQSFVHFSVRSAPPMTCLNVPIFPVFTRTLSLIL